MRQKLKDFFFDNGFFKLASFVWGGISFVCLVLGFFDILSYWFVVVSLFFSVFLYNYNFSVSVKKFFKGVSDNVVDLDFVDLDIINLKNDEDDDKWKK